MKKKSKRFKRYWVGLSHSHWDDKSVKPKWSDLPSKNWSSTKKKVKPRKGNAMYFMKNKFKPLKGEFGKLKYIFVRVTPDLDGKLIALAKKNSLTKSKLIRQMIEHCLMEEK